MHITITIWVILAAWRWGDWNRFQQFHSTMLYMSLMNLYYLFLTNKYLLWRVQPDFDLPYTFIVSMYTIIVFPFTVLLYLSNLPETPKKQILHTLKWVVIYFAVEWVAELFNRIVYDNGWHLGWSFLFLLVMFPMLQLHYKKPLITYIISIFIIIFLLFFFDVPWKSPSYTP